MVQRLSEISMKIRNCWRNEKDDGKIGKTLLLDHGYFGMGARKVYREQLEKLTMPELLPAGNMKELGTTRYPITKNARISIWMINDSGAVR